MHRIKLITFSLIFFIPLLANAVESTYQLQNSEVRNVVATTPQRFTDNTNGTVTDNQTGLVWLLDAGCTDTVGGIYRANNSIGWSDAQSWSAMLADGYCGLKDSSGAGEWRIPSLMELLSLIDLRYNSPALPEGHPFKNVQNSVVWSSSTVANYPELSWTLDVDSGQNYKSKTNDTATKASVWPVRNLISSNVPSPVLSSTTNRSNTDKTEPSTSVRSISPPAEQITQTSSIPVTITSAASINAPYKGTKGTISFSFTGSATVADIKALTTSDSWITIGAIKFKGKTPTGTIAYTVTANKDSSRTGNISVAGNIIAVTQAASPSSPCKIVTAVATPSTISTPGGEVGLYVKVSTPTCSWSVTSNNNGGWISGLDAKGVVGTTTIYGDAAPNITKKTRSVTVTVATADGKSSKTLTYKQEGKDYPFFKTAGSTKQIWVDWDSTGPMVSVSNKLYAPQSNAYVCYSESQNVDSEPTSVTECATLDLNPGADPNLRYRPIMKYNDKYLDPDKTYYVKLVSTNTALKNYKRTFDITLPVKPTYIPKTASGSDELYPAPTGFKVKSITNKIDPIDKSKYSEVKLTWDPLPTNPKFYTIAMNSSSLVDTSPLQWGTRVTLPTDGTLEYTVNLKGPASYYFALAGVAPIDPRTFPFGHGPMDACFADECTVAQRPTSPLKVDVIGDDCTTNFTTECLYGQWNAKFNAIWGYFGVQYGSGPMLYHKEVYNKVVETTLTMSQGQSFTIDASGNLVLPSEMIPHNVMLLIDDGTPTGKLTEIVKTYTLSFSKTNPVIIDIKYFMDGVLSGENTYTKLK